MRVYYEDGHHGAVPGASGQPAEWTTASQSKPSDTDVDIGAERGMRETTSDSGVANGDSTG